MYSNGASLNVALFVLMVNHLRFVFMITLQLLGEKIIPYRVTSPIAMQLKQKDWRYSSLIKFVRDANGFSA